MIITIVIKLKIKNSPLFHAYSFRYRVAPSLLTLNGPSSIMAPDPSEEQPGPASIIW